MPTPSPNPMLAALLDEYRRAAIDLNIVLEMLSQEEYDRVRDSKTSDPDCRSVATICRHVVKAGYTYASYLNTINSGDWLEYEQQPESPQKAILEINRMLDHTHEVLSGIWNHSLEEIESWSFDSRWNVTYDAEQLLEHAIVHILRHRRQIEGFLQ